MATVTLTDLFNNLSNWQGDLLWASTGTMVGTSTSTAFSFTFPSGHPFAGYNVIVSGSGFTYFRYLTSASPIGGTISNLIILDDTNQFVLGVSGIAANSLASDLALFAANVFGWTDANGFVRGSQPNAAWSMLLSGNDTVNGTSGRDANVLPGMGNGSDLYNMGDGDDWIGGGMGNDTVDGGNGRDGLSFNETHYQVGISASQGIIVDVTAGTVIDAWGDTDTIISIEAFQGSAFNDLIRGGDIEETFWGLRGKDTLDGGASNGNPLQGNGGDWVRYDDDQWLGGLRGIIVNLETSNVGGTIKGTIRDGFGSLDRTIDIESVVGTGFNDSFTGSSVQNVFVGGEGRDSYDGAGGRDILWFFYQFGNVGGTGIVVDLTRASGQIRNDGYGNVETAVSIENIVGSGQNDIIKGSAGTNILEGYFGADTMTGAGGNDEFKYYWRPEAGETDTITDFRASGAANRDQMQFWVSNWGVSNVLTLVNGTAATQAVSTFIFNAATQVLSWDEDGTGGIGAIDVALLQGVTSLTAANFDLL